MTINQELTRLGATQALTIASEHSADLLINSSVWRAAHHVADKLFSDNAEVFLAHNRTIDTVCRTTGEQAQLEDTEWACYARTLQAAYIIGISVGRRMQPTDGAR